MAGLFLLQYTARLNFLRDNPPMNYLCPLCHQPLLLQENTWRCENRHQFDRAREGYVNLLPVQHKRSKQPGDSAEMMQARRQFLNEGYYQPLQQRVGDLLAQLPDSGPLTLLDIGCGEGYYTGAVAERLQAQRQASVYGLDVSREAIRSAAKRYRDVAFCVASSRRLPFGDGSINAMMRIYAPCHADELTRVVAPGGVMLTVTPGPRHLIQFKELIYQEAKLHPAGAESLPGWALQQEQALSYEMMLSSESAATLLQMTPLAWRARPEVWGRLATCDSFACETDFVLRLWQRQP